MDASKSIIAKPDIKGSICYFALRLGIVAIILSIICIVGSNIYYKKQCKTVADTACEKVFSKAEEYWAHYLTGAYSKSKRNELRLEILKLWEDYSICSSISIGDTLYISAEECATLNCIRNSKNLVFFMDAMNSSTELKGVYHCIAIEGYDYHDMEYNVEIANVNWNKYTFSPKKMTVINPDNNEVVMDVELPGAYYNTNAMTDKDFDEVPMIMKYCGNPECNIRDYYKYLIDPTFTITAYMPDDYCCGYLSEHQDMNPHDQVLTAWVTYDNTNEEYQLEMRSDYSYISKIYAGKATSFSVKSISAIVLVYIITCAICAYLRYYKQKSVYDLFEYRKQTTDAMAHDLKTPLAIASAYVENLKENISEDKKEQYLNSIDTSIKYMNRLISDILEFSNSQESSAKIIKDEIEVRTVVEKIKDLLAPTCERKGLQIDIEGNNKVNTDIKLLEQSFLNLIGNAVKYAPADSVISIIIDKQSAVIKNKTENEIKNVDRLLEPYVKGDTYRGENTGSGLGLAIADSNLGKLGYKLSVDVTDKVFTATIKF